MQKKRAYFLRDMRRRIKRKAKKMELEVSLVDSLVTYSRLDISGSCRFLLLI